MTSAIPETPSLLLLEIGTEEIPARFLPGAIDDLKKISGDILIENRIGYNSIRTFATPRRLSMIADGISLFQNDVAKEVFGPSKKAAFDEQGNPTKAAAGFANSLGLNVSDLEIRLKGKGEYLVAVIEEKGKETKTVLPEIMRKIILSLHFPKAMRWGDGKMTFVRPIHWILAISGSETIPFEIDGIMSTNTTKGHRFLSPAAFQIKNTLSYMSLLENNFVILDNDKRKNLIKTGIESLFENSQSTPVIDNELLDIVNFLVEYPVPVLCSFHREYLMLPKELLITVMKDHQKYFAVQDSSGSLVNSFVVISNTRAENADTVRIGAERVIKARFDDAKFYFHEDTAKSLFSRVEELKKVTFHDKLGSVFEKTERIISNVNFLCEKTVPSLKDKAKRSAVLSKADLITGVVREFPELQGVMGKYYALHDKEDPEIAIALEEQYLPPNSGGRLPQTETGAILSIADKADNIASFFSIGLIPSGSEDPFALRRQAMAVVSILLEKGYAITLNELFAFALGNFKDTKNTESILKNIMDFMEQRIDFIFASSGNASDLVKSILPLSTGHPLKTVAARIDALKKFKEDPAYAEFLLAIKRIFNIIPKSELPSVRDDLLLQVEEKHLYDLFNKVKKDCLALIKDNNFHEGLRMLATMTSPVNSFFDKVLVMDKRQEIKENRLSLLKEIGSTASYIADFSKLL